MSDGSDEAIWSHIDYLPPNIGDEVIEFLLEGDMSDGQDTIDELCGRMNAMLDDDARVRFEPGNCQPGVDRIRLCYEAVYTPCATHPDDDADKRMERQAKVNAKQVLKQAAIDIDGEASAVTGDASRQKRIDTARDYIIDHIGDASDEAQTHLDRLMGILCGRDDTP